MHMSKRKSEIFDILFSCEEKILTDFRIYFSVLLITELLCSWHLLNLVSQNKHQARRHTAILQVMTT